VLGQLVDGPGIRGFGLLALRLVVDHLPVVVGADMICPYNSLIHVSIEHFLQRVGHMSVVPNLYPDEHYFPVISLSLSLIFL
jgi:hypothetical protein